MKTRTLFLTILIMLCSCCGMAQSASPFVFSASGGYFSNGTCSISETIGELSMIKTLTLTNIILTEGFQQPFEVDLPTVVPPEISSNIPPTIFPNPCNGNCFIQFNCTADYEVTMHVFDTYGKSLFIERFPVTAGIPIHQLNLIDLPDGLYILLLNESFNNEMITIRSLKIQIIK